MVIEVTVQVRVSDFEKGFDWYRTLLRREADYAPHDGFAEWELIPGSWLQVAEGAPTEGNGPLRLGVTDLEAERNRVIDELAVEPFEIYSRQEVNVKWGTFSDPWGNRIGFFEYLDKAEEAQIIKRVRNR
ncbi:VOC family protein [Alicyclobacillus sp. SO9]|uniref:VOC family protein n=1 Tax=Alicyclobacillus sp. SO9 TaxID=2665646 RepID=UPI0018E79C45|nr:VOC family protein [Alicyclobacillus sp. SO9]QQE81482.1 VOC family protein [Alicyclobacillus sp. SO9]